jgi:transposase
MTLSVAGGTRIYLALAPTDMRKGFDGLAAQVSQVLRRDPFSGQLFLFRGKRGDRLKALYWDGSGLCLFAKRLERGRFVWPRVSEGAVTLTPAQLAMLIEGLDWRRAVLPEAPPKPTAM